jgi:galactofuranose transport system permease protein
LIHFFKVQPFIATLGGMFLARGVSLLINTNSITLNHPFYKTMSEHHILIIGNTFITINVVILAIVVLIAVYLAHYTRFGRTVYAIGGNEQSALLMGLPVGRTKVLVYTLSGFCSSLAGVVMMFYIKSGNPLHGLGMEMDAIAAAVIGGTLLSGGVGYIFGTVVGVMILGTIASLINFQGGSVNTWWIRIINASLILIFCLLQLFFESQGKSRKKS